MKVLINREPVDGPWGGGNHFVRSFFNEAKNHGIELTTRTRRDLDAVLVADPRPDHLGLSVKEIVKIKSKYPHVKVIHRVNECDARKREENNIDPMLREVSKVSDVTVFVSKWLEQHHLDLGWHAKDTVVVINGVAPEFCKMIRKTESSQTRIVTHHWSYNEMKGFDLYEEIDEWIADRPDCVFTYIGRERGTFRNARVIPALSGEKLADALRNNDVYISASRWDPGPNHIIESLACGLPTYVYKDGGGSIEMVGADHVFDTFDELKKIILEKNFKKNTALAILPWEEVVVKYFDIIRKCVESG